jgi:hypothetical protein
MDEKVIASRNAIFKSHDCRTTIESPVHSNLQDLENRDIPLLSALQHPFLDIGRRQSDLVFRAARQRQRSRRANNGTLPTTNAASVIHHANPIRHRERIKRTARYAIFTAGTNRGVYHTVKTGTSNSSGDVELGYAAQDSTAARTTIADVRTAVTLVAGGVNQAAFLGCAQFSQGFLFGDGASHPGVVESTLYRRKHQAIFQRMVAPFTDQFLLYATNAVTHSPRFGIFDHF